MSAPLTLNEAQVSNPAGGLGFEKIRAKPPHVLYVIDEICELGGAERALIETVRRLDSRRFRVSIVTFRINPDIDVLSSLPCPLHVLPLNSVFNLNALKMALRLVHIIQRDNVSIVQTFFETSDLWAAPLAWLAGCPVLLSSRRDMGIYRSRKHQTAYRFINGIFDRVITVSEEVRSFCLQQDHLDPARVETLHNGVDLQQLDRKAYECDARQRFDIPANAPLISTVANVRRIKGIDVLMRAASIVCRDFPEAVFVVVGSVLEQDTYEQLRELLKSLRLTRNVVFLGPLSNPYTVLRASTVFCLPSRSEGFSNALIEAMASRLPCVATFVGGNVEALSDGRSGFLVSSEDHNAMAERILRLLKNPALARAMGESARKAVEARFNMVGTIERLMGIYDTLLAVRNG